MATFTRQSLETDTRSQLDEIDATYAEERDELRQPFADPNADEIVRLDEALGAAKSERQQAHQATSNRQDTRLLAGVLLTFGALSFIGLAIAVTRLVNGSSPASMDQELAPLAGLIASLQGAIRDVGLDRTVAIAGFVLVLVGVLRVALPRGSSLRQRLVSFMLVGPVLVALPYYDLGADGASFSIFEGATFAALLATPGAIWLRWKGFQGVVDTVGRHVRWIATALGLIVLLVIVLSFIAKDASPTVVTAFMLLFALLGVFSSVLIHQGCAMRQRLDAYDRAAGAHANLEGRRCALAEDSKQAERGRASRLETLESRRSNKREAVLARWDELLRDLEAEERWSERVGRSSSRTAAAGAQA